MHDVFLVTQNNYPYVFKAFELISHDCGRQAGHENYAVPLVYFNRMGEIESKLSKLHQEADLDFELLCIGEESEKDLMLTKLNLKDVDEFLQRFFEEYQ